MPLFQKRIGTKGFTLVELSGSHCDHWDPDCTDLTGRAGSTEAARRMQCNQQPQATRPRCLNFESVNGAFPRGNTGPLASSRRRRHKLDVPGPRLHRAERCVRPGGALGNLQAAVNQKRLGRFAPACPWHVAQATPGRSATASSRTTWVAAGRSCNNPPGGCDSPFQKYCNGRVGSGETVPSAISPLTYVGYRPSMSWGNTAKSGWSEACFSRGGSMVRVGPGFAWADVTRRDIEHPAVG